ncbi:Bro-N domain-containing protein [Patescibacteria group bacterium]|nr:Bro-N domain-containing protein [Patescibacteria group bacterium]MCG2702741.1 Bro-N domain-containing protein [Candidatus Parcubacteria bacterium]MBU4265441.1 Bro-N domain-containing protein [Patescibacteria group bacterium]MBU4390491.1 Bro-N domain-containing protein [Patescibacteria group bacterium]MBU4430549.1 Bro-N domain-containing protein [Patescibacteria group bacterium]
MKTKITTKIPHSVVLFNQKQVRRYWNEKKEQWYFSIIDIIEILTKSSRPRKYWNDLKSKLSNEGSEVSEKIGHLKMIAPDGKKRKTDVASTETLLRLIQSIPSPKAEPFKLWLAKVGKERLDEIADPEKAFNRAIKTYSQKGYSKEWINQRLKSIEVRKELTDEWQTRGVKEGIEFAILTDEITHAWSEMSIKQYKKFKNLKKENLRDNMTNLELVLNMLAEATTTEISKEKKPKTFPANRQIAKQGGKIAGNTRKEIEKQTGKKIVSSKNIKQLRSQKLKKLN